MQQSLRWLSLPTWHAAKLLTSDMPKEMLAETIKTFAHLSAKHT
jgi:hypothetical protein